MPSARHNLQPFLHDAWAPLSHLIGSGTERVGRHDGLVATWVDDVDARRLLSYRVLDAYADNVRRYYLPTRMWQSDIATDARGGIVERAAAPAEGYREYGHAALLVTTARSLLLGHEQSVGLPPGVAADPNAARVLAWAQDWARRERVEDKVFESEANSIGLGDGVLTLGWDPRTRRPRLRVADPGMFFPDWAAIDHPDFAEWDDQDFPPVVHLCWEVERGGDTFVHRVTWRMEKTGQLVSMAYDDAPATPWTCRYRVQEWRLDKLKGQTVYDLPEGQGSVIAEVDLGVDFIPVVHVPNDHNKHRWGRSLLLSVTQVLDDLAGAETDLNTDSALVASPPTVFSGVAGAVDVEGGPGATYSVGDGAAQLMDTSKALDALLKYSERLEETLSTSSRVASVLLGKVDPSDAASGYAMRLGLAPTDSLIAEMARVRAAKYALVLRMAVRLAQAVGPAGGGLPAGKTPDLVLHLGTGLPTARQNAIEDAVTLYDKGLASLPTVLAMLREAGLPIDDVQREAQRIVARDTRGAVELVDATGDVDAARRRLGLIDAQGRPTPQGVPVDPSPAADPADPARGQQRGAGDPANLGV